MAGDALRGYETYQHSADRARGHGILYVLGHSLGGAGMACIALERFDEAGRLLGDAVRLTRELDDRLHMFRIADMVSLAAAAGQLQRAAR